MTLSKTETNNVFFPTSLQAMSNWVLWKLEERKGKATKVPYQTNGQRASSTNRNTWSSFDEVQELRAMDDQYSGLGLMMSDGIVFVDVDHCISDDGTIDKRGADILSAFPLSFAEISQSGTGLHILTRGVIPRSFHNQKQGVEMYSSARFCAMTGNAIQRNEPTAEQDGIDYVFNKYGKSAKKSCGFSSVDAISSHSDRWVLSHAENVTGEKGRDFNSLFNRGDISRYGSASEADSALCTLLAFWCDRDPCQIDRLFRTSALYRSKWERQSYRDATILHACSHIPESISEYQKRMNREKADAIAKER